MPQQPHFTPELFRWLRKLKRNNDRQWFQAQKETYIEVVRDPLLRFIADVGPRLDRISPRFVADPRPTGGSMFRIYRDTRFSRDKSPYKTHAAAQFRHEAGKDVHAPGFYLHLSPGDVFIGGGIWHPDGKTLTAIRERLVDDPAVWKKAISGRAFKRDFELGGDSLKRPPRGFDPDHPMVEDLKRKDFVAMTRMDEEAACAPDFLNRFIRACRAMGPMVEWICRGVGVAY
jgi:uncharacterized protein (TIGR02453 family)